MKKMSARIGAMASLYMLMPAIALAQAQIDESGDFSQFIGSITTFINDVLIPLVFAIALLVFLYGVFRYFIASGMGGGSGDDDREEGKKMMLYSILGFVLMVSIFGIVNLIAGGLGFTGGEDELQNNLPSAPTR